MYIYVYIYVYIYIYIHIYIYVYICIHKFHPKFHPKASFMWFLMWSPRISCGQTSQDESWSSPWRSSLRGAKERRCGGYTPRFREWTGCWGLLGLSDWLTIIMGMGNDFYRSHGNGNGYSYGLDHETLIPDLFGTRWRYWLTESLIYLKMRLSWNGGTPFQRWFL